MIRSIFLLFLLLASFSLFAQSEENLAPSRNELSTDISGIFIHQQYRIDFNHRPSGKFAIAVGLATRSQFSSVIIDTASTTPSFRRTQPIEDAFRFIDARLGARWYLGLVPDRSFWIQANAIVSLAEWQSEVYKEVQLQSIFPSEDRVPKTSFGAEIVAGYRYVFRNGISLSAQLALTSIYLRDTFQSERFAPSTFENGVLETRFNSSFLTVGYVW